MSAKKDRRIVGYNILILLGASVLLTIIGRSTLLNEGSQALFYLAMWIIIQFFTNIIIGVVYVARQEGKIGREFILSAFVVVLIGFSACVGSARLI